MLRFRLPSGPQQSEVYAVQEEASQHKPQARSLPLPLSRAHLLADGTCFLLPVVDDVACRGTGLEFFDISPPFDSMCWFLFRPTYRWVVREVPSAVRYKQIVQGRRCGIACITSACWLYVSTSEVLEAVSEQKLEGSVIVRRQNHVNYPSVPFVVSARPAA